MPDMKLTWPKRRRLTRRRQYTECYDRGERHFTRYFVVFARDPLTGDGVSVSEADGESSPRAPEFRLGLAVTRKCGNAVERNRIKRVLREFFRLRQQELPAMDIVVTPKRHLRADKIHLGLVDRDLSPLLDTLRRKLRSGHGSLRAESCRPCLPPVSAQEAASSPLDGGRA